MYVLGKELCRVVRPQAERVKAETPRFSIEANLTIRMHIHCICTSRLYFPVNRTCQRDRS